MKHNTDTLWVAITGGGISSIAYLLGGIDNLLIAFVILMTLDYLTGIAAAFYDKKVSSKSAIRGLMKKGAMFSLVIVATQLDIILGNEGQFVRYAILMFLIGTEGISLIENLGRLDIKVPKILSDRFSQLKDDHVEENKDKITK
ncbi:phage holin family protein [Bacillus gobiensis]|uniref:phage holin family protein n=1 Tax=Bacillus gobiensis TaxID=1441095 RepID=UPI003D1D261E